MRYLRKTDGQIFPYTELLAARDDMSECDAKGNLLGMDMPRSAGASANCDDLEQELAEVLAENADLRLQVTSANDQIAQLLNQLEQAGSPMVDVPDDAVIDGMDRNELEVLAKSLQIQFPHNVGDDKLRQRIKEYVANAGQ